MRAAFPFRNNIVCKELFFPRRKIENVRYRAEANAPYAKTALSEKADD
jgi:hypothetical protein